MHQRFDVGSRVYSAQYGAGEVLAVEGIGDAEKLTVRFDRAGERQLMTAFSLLELQADPRPAETAGRAVPASPALTRPTCSRRPFVRFCTRSSARAR